MKILFFSLNVFDEMKRCPLLLIVYAFIFCIFLYLTLTKKNDNYFLVYNNSCRCDIVKFRKEKEKNTAYCSQLEI